MKKDEMREPQELNEQELEQAAGAGASVPKPFQCSCGCTEYEWVTIYRLRPMPSYAVKQCKNCKKQYRR